ncbi:thioredoxin [Aquipluma nitroreducens]|uniref:Thioredoxin n=1 Tax=Aquipluma nitroreducens TaxID=2010828 RepID=A0A5K7S9V4_9BACT|nr:thioredoxin [Aquipluma nitroreducens]BBE18246.1 thioredoxin [Aquipluma nitroreducens]
MQTTFIVIGVIIVAVFVFRYIAMAQMKNTPLVADHAKVLTLTEQNFQQQTKGKVVLIDFWASWCAPCRMMAPVLNEVATELKGNSHVGKVDIQQYQSLANKFKVRNIPTMILLKNGAEVNRFVGIKSKEFLLKEIAKVG